jgi:hypothetical protein
VLVFLLVSDSSYYLLQPVANRFLAENYVNFVVTLIAVNLQLSVVYRVQTVHWTKYYIGGSFLASLAIMTPGGPFLFTLPSIRRSRKRDHQRLTMSGGGTR